MAMINTNMNQFGPYDVTVILGSHVLQYFLKCISIETSRKTKMDVKKENELVILKAIIFLSIARSK